MGFGGAWGWALREETVRVNLEPSWETVQEAAEKKKKG